MANLLPIIAIGAAAVLLSKKKKKPTNNKVKELVEGGVPTPGSAAFDESELDLEDATGGEDVGEFEITKESLEYDDEDDYDEIEKSSISSGDSYKKMRDKCDKFINAVHIVVTEAGEMPVNKVAVEQSILPAMRQSAHEFAQNFGVPLDEESFGPRLVLAGLEAIAPGCGWEFSEAEAEFRYADGLRADGGRMGEVLGSIIDLSVIVLSEINQG